MLPSELEGVTMILYKEIRALSDDYEHRLKKQIDSRVLEMDKDDKLHHILYQVLGITAKEGHDIDVYQNKGRFLYKYAGSFLEAAAKLCIQYKYPDAVTTRIKNTLGQRPATFEIDALVPNGDAFEIEIIMLKFTAETWRTQSDSEGHIIFCLKVKNVC